MVFPTGSRNKRDGNRTHQYSFFLCPPKFHQTTSHSMPSRVPPEDPAGLCPSLLFPSLFPLSTQPKSLSMLCCHFNFSLFLFPFVSYFSFYHLVFTCFPTAPLRCRDRPQLTSLFFFFATIRPRSQSDEAIRSGEGRHEPLHAALFTLTDSDLVVARS